MSLQELLFTSPVVHLISHSYHALLNGAGIKETWTGEKWSLKLMVRLQLISK